MSWFFNAMLWTFGRCMPWHYPVPPLQAASVRQGRGPAGVRAAKRAAAKRRNRMQHKARR